MADRSINYRILVIVIFIGIVIAIAIFLALSSLTSERLDETTLPSLRSTAEPALSDSGSTSSAAQPSPTATIERPSPTGTPEVEPTMDSIEPIPEQHTDLASLLHTVRGNDNLFRISMLYRVPIESIMITNGIADSRDIFEGQVLVIPTAERPLVPTAPIAVAPIAGTPTPTNTPIPPPPTSINGTPIDSIVVMSSEVIENARQIFIRGQELGVNAHAFSKVGDSTIENPHFLARFDEGTYNLGDYAYLQSVIDYFAGSFARQGLAVRRGFHSWTVTDPMWADKEICLPNETPVACEIRINRPAILLIRLGSNDVGVPGSFDLNIRQVVDYAVEQGVIPVIGTKADRFEGPDDINNTILRQIAADYNLPLWDFDLVASTLPGRGLYEDDVHMTIFYPHDYTQARALETGHGVHNLTALMVLETILREVMEPAGE